MFPWPFWKPRKIFLYRKLNFLIVEEFGSAVEVEGQFGNAKENYFDGNLRPYVLWSPNIMSYTPACTRVNTIDPVRLGDLV
jgi:hypothetical protein